MVMLVVSQVAVAVPSLQEQLDIMVNLVELLVVQVEHQVNWAQVVVGVFPLPQQFQFLEVMVETEFLAAVVVLIALLDQLQQMVVMADQDSQEAAVVLL
jgi:hypothetical protein